MDDVEKMVRDAMSDVFARYSEEADVPRNILSRWPWVEKDTIELIANGGFQIDGLPKLHSTDELQNAYLKKSLKGLGRRSCTDHYRHHKVAILIHGTNNILPCVAYLYVY